MLQKYGIDDNMLLYTSNGVLLDNYYRLPVGICGSNNKVRIDNVLTKRVCFDCEKYRTYNHSLLISSIISSGFFLLAFIFSLFT